MTWKLLESALSDLRNLDKDVRAVATCNLIGIGSSALPALMKLLSDDEWVIRYRAAEALGGIRDTRTIGALILLTTDQKDHVRYMATKALSQMQDPRMVPVLIRMLCDDHIYTRKIAAMGLAAAGDSAAFIPLQKAMGCEPDPDVRTILQKAFSQMKN